MGVPRVSRRKAGRWYVELLACKGGTSRRLLDYHIFGFPRFGMRGGA